MNQQLQDFARASLKEGLAQLLPKNHRIFALMYGRKDGKRSVEDAVAMPYADIVDEMEPEKLDWAMQQVQRSIEDNRRAATRESL
jgi:hypothetical protein